MVTLPASVAIGVWVWSSSGRRLALLWGLLFGLGLLLVLITKVAFAGWGIGVRTLDFTGISGHAMRACAVLPVMACLMARNALPRTRLCALALGAGLAGLIGFSRIVTQAHSASEALAGCLLGALVSLVFIRHCEAQPATTFPRWLIALSVLALLSASRAEPAPTQSWVNGLAVYLAGHKEPVTREAWLAGRRRGNYE